MMRRWISVCQTSVLFAALSVPALSSLLAEDAGRPRSVLGGANPPGIFPDAVDAEPAYDYDASGNNSVDDAAIGDLDADAIAPSDAEVEVFTERYPNGKIKISREVIRDAKKNYVNHGVWRMWSQDGVVIAEGEYAMGVRHGVWKRRFTSGEMFAELPFSLFKAPFLSTVTLDHDKLHGKWTIHDSEGRKVTEWEYENGRRHGQWSWWFPDGGKMQEITYREGAIDGKLLQWDAEGDIVESETYEAGRKLDRKIVYHPGSRQKRSEINYLFAQQIVVEADDWWNARPARFTQSGEDQKHGRATFWTANGQVEVQGEYRDGQPEGLFTWWHPNGQKAVRGKYVDGQMHGDWTWWHENGAKAIEGGFSEGAPIGAWTAWKPDGKVAREYNVSEGESLITAPATENSFPAPPAPFGASRPLPRNR